MARENLTCCSSCMAHRIEAQSFVQKSTKCPVCVSFYFLFFCVEFCTQPDYVAKRWNEEFMGRKSGHMDRHLSAVMFDISDHYLPTHLTWCDYGAIDRTRSSRSDWQNLVGRILQYDRTHPKFLVQKQIYKNKITQIRQKQNYSRHNTFFQFSILLFRFQNVQGVPCFS